MRRRFWMSAFLMLAASFGCRTPVGPNTPASAGLHPAELVDPNGYGDGPPPAILRELFRTGEEVRMSRKPAVVPPKRSCLCLSGGGAFGSFSAGVLCGWTETGERPEFDVVSGVSTGALVAVFAFLGPEYDAELKRFYTTLGNDDIFVKRRPLHALFSDSLADNAPLAAQIDRAVTPQLVARIAEEHKIGRRLYIGTTDLDGRRPVVWDVGAMASRGDEESRRLISRLLLASAAIPAFFPPVEIPVSVDGTSYVERHIDGGTTQALFFRPPYLPPEMRKRPLADSLWGSDMYVIIAGKLYADPEAVKPRLLNIAGSSVSTLLFAETRGELVKLYAASVFSGMNYHLAAIPQDFPASGDSTNFDPAAMSALFEEGRRQIREGVAWRPAPPGVGEGEVLIQRAGTRLIRTPREPKH